MTIENPTPDKKESDDSRPDSTPPTSESAPSPSPDEETSSESSPPADADAEKTSDETPPEAEKKKAEVEKTEPEKKKAEPEAQEEKKEVEVETAPPTPAAPAEAGVEVEMQSESKPETPGDSESSTASTSDAEVATPAKKEDAAAGEEADATMAEAVAQDQRLETRLKPGERRDVRLVQVGEKESFVDFGGASEGTIATAELRDKEGELRVKEGEAFPAIVDKVGDTVSFTTGRGKKLDTLRLREIEAAAENKVPLQGRVKKTNKGGFEVDLQGARAFCPFSQIDIGYCDQPEQFVGQDLSFLVMTYERGGRNIVLSRRKILEEEAKAAAQETRKQLEVGATFEGVVRRLQPYGAFVDIGGIDGLVHVSEISHTHIRDPKDVLKVGQKVPVRVIKLEGLGTKKERVSLSMKELAEDPWSSAAEKWPVGATVHGKVVRLTDFGAFVELEPGVDGLIHISQISSERIDHPSDELSVGQEVDARVLDLDVDNHRISLSLRPEGEERPQRREQAGRSGGGSSSPRQYTAGPEAEEEKPGVDVTDMEYEDAVEALKRKFDQH